MENIFEMFSYCKSLSFIPDISKWNTKNIINANRMFFACSSLIKLPDISLWNTQNFKNINEMFSYHLV